MCCHDIAPEDEVGFMLNVKILLALEGEEHPDNEELKKYFDDGCNPMTAAAHYQLRRGRCK